MSEGTAGGAEPRDQGMSLMKLGRFAEAAQALQRAVEADVNDEMSWRLLGGARASSGDSTGAVEAFRRAVELAPTSAKSHYNFALALQSIGQSYEAKSHLEKALSLDPNYEQARIRLSEIKNAAENNSYGPAAGMETNPTSVRGGSGGDDLNPVVGIGMNAPAKPAGNVPDRSTNIGSGDTGGLAPIGAAFLASAPAQSASPNTQSGNTDGLSSLGGGSLNPPTMQPPTMAPPTMLPPNPAQRPVLSAPGSLPGASLPPGSYNAPTLAPPLPGRAGDTPAMAGATAQNAYGAPMPVLGQQYGMSENTSGIAGGMVPQELQGKWNWAAFLWTWIWMLGHGMIGQGIGLFAVFVVLRFIPYVGSIAGFGISVFFGMKGYEMGWRAQRYDSVDAFKAKERTYAVAALWLFGVVFVLGIVVAIIAISQRR